MRPCSAPLWDQERTEVPSSSTPSSSAGPWPREAPPPALPIPPPPRVDCEAEPCRCPLAPDAARLLLSFPLQTRRLLELSCRSHLPLRRRLEKKGVPFLALQLPFGKFTPRPLPIPTSNARHVALAGLRRAEATWKIHRRVWVSDSDRPLPAWWDGGHWAHRAVPSQRGPGQAGGGTQPGEQPLQPPRAPRRLRKPQAEQVVPFIC